MSAHQARRLQWPVSVLTGMLGSGKTTILRRVLGDPAMRGTAVLVNEIGEIGIDHLLIERIDGEAVLMRSGCLCCTLRADLPQTLNALRRRWLGDDTLELRRIVIETTGLARPGPILRELAQNPLIAGDFPLASVTTTVDAQHALKQLPARTEAREQLAVADIVVLTKTDIVDATTRLAVRREIVSLNPDAPVIVGAESAVEVQRIFPLAPAAMAGVRRGWPDAINATASPDITFHPTPHILHSHDGIGTVALRAFHPVAWDALMALLTNLVGELAPSLLRFKGIFEVAGADQPVVVHGVHDSVYPAEMLQNWPDGERGSRLVLVIDGLAKHRGRIAEIATASDIAWTVTG